MQFHLHIGTEKTGSSFLQTHCALGRKGLQGQGVWVPPGTKHDERSMKAGRISAGNGRRVADRVTQGEWQALAVELETARKQATAQGCHSVMVTNEQLLAPLSASETLVRFRDTLVGCGFKGLKILVILRDPLDQFLSLYKHRAKRGTAGSIATWAETGYHLPHHLAGLRRGVSELGIDLTARKYGRGDGLLEQIFFADWLGVTLPQVEVPASVNPSLALSELQLLRVLAAQRPDMVVPLYEHLLRLEPSDKLQGAALEAHAGIVAGGAVSRPGEWRAWNDLLPAGEELVIPEPPAEIPPAPQELGFSYAQITELMTFLNHSATPRFLAQLVWATRLRPVLGRAKRAVMGSDLR